MERMGFGRSGELRVADCKVVPDNLKGSRGRRVSIYRAAMLGCDPKVHSIAVLMAVASGRLCSMETRRWSTHD